MTPDQLDQLGRCTSADFAAAADITRQLLEAEQRQLVARGATTGAVPPPTNRGGKSNSPYGQVKLVLEDGVIKQVPIRRGYGGDAAFVDWLNFTIGEETFDQFPDDVTERYDFSAGQVVVVEEGGCYMPVNSEQVAIVISNRLQQIFGFGIESKLGYGLNFYKESWTLPETWGSVCYGGQNRTILITLTGTGLAAAREGWEDRLVKFLESASRPRITRLDLAHDDYTGETYSVDRADQDHTDGLFNCGGRNPRCEHRGDWKHPDGKGRSFYVGNRKNGKYCRVYEKGRELGDQDSEWVRIEVEFKSVDRVIPFDAITRPGEYLAAAYPAFSFVSQRQERIETTSRVVQANVDRAWNWLRHQCGIYVYHLVELVGVDEFLRRVARSDKVPAFAKVPHWALSEKAIHEIKSFKPRVSLDAAASAW
ncbi:replication initiation factor domain-containing protein [Azonexus sp.]|jgi:phage replication initiation protein|uniref:replication initiation factor domain-containing protein n=1 Tax=Azonexus sp. TaxID=1872668 RepID=UPI002830732C|nr:replication initiation factor domain-containing protein [Azonexus sp.]MDR1996472.1 replication initiation factor domain-containing protein [Azonexus sp.]